MNASQIKTEIINSQPDIKIISINNYNRFLKTTNEKNCMSKNHTREIT